MDMSWVALIVLFFLLLGFVALVLPIIAMVTASRASQEVEKLRREVAALRRQITTGASGPADVGDPRRSPPMQTPPVAHQPSPEPVTPTWAETPVDRPRSVEEPQSSPPPLPKPQAPSSQPSSPLPKPQAPSPKPSSPLPKSQAPGWEEKLGTRLAVWIGAVFMALAGIFLVRYMAKQGVFGPTTRVIASALFGLGMIAVGEWQRLKLARIAQGLSAAGVAVLYGAIIAATHLHDLLPKSTGFTLAIAVTAGAIVLSLRHGPFVALLGLVGGFLTPALLSTGTGSAPQLFGYLMLLQLAMIALSRSRQWWWLATLAMAAGMAWVGLWIALRFRPEDAHALSLFLLATVAVFVVTSSRAAATNVFARALSWATTAAGLILSGWLLNLAGFDNTQWTYFTLLGAGCMIFARLREDHMSIAWLAAGLSVFNLFIWSNDHESADAVRLAWTIVMIGALYGIGAYLCLWRSRKPQAWALLASVVGVILYLLSLGVTEDLLTDNQQFALAAGLAVAYVLAGVSVLKPDWSVIHADLAATRFITAGIIVLSVALHLWLEDEWIAVALSLQLPAIAWAAGRLRLSGLRVVAMGVAVVTALHLMGPVTTFPISEHWLYNWLTYGYAIPAAAMLAAGALLRQQADRPRGNALQFLGLLLLLIMTLLLIRHGFHPTGWNTGRTNVFEVATYAIATLAIWIGLGELSRYIMRTPAVVTARIAGVIAAFDVLMTVTAWNPLWTRADVGSTYVFNGLLYIYGLPLVMIALLAVRLIGRGRTTLARLCGCIAFAMAFVLITLQVRHVFHHPYLHTGGISNAEWYSYSAAWLVFAILLLVAGIWRASKALRLASLAMMLVVVLKAFLFDMRHLEDLYRVASFLGLGISLLGLAVVYQKLVFRRSNSDVNGSL